MRFATIAFALPGFLGLSVVPAYAQLVITPIYTNPSDPNAIGNQPDAAAIESTINAAIQMYEATYTNAVNVTIAFDNMSGGLGASSTSYYPVNYSSYISHLKATKPSGALSNYVNYIPNSTNPVNGASTVYCDSANCRAIGYGNGYNAGGTDSIISLNTSITNDSRTGTQDPNKFDLLAVVEHEMDEALGLGSALNGLSNGAAAPTDHIDPEDLFRFSAPGVRSFTTSATAGAYFSTDNGATDIIGFNASGNTGGNHADYQDWATSGTPHVQDAFEYNNTQPNFGFPESTALQAIGYNVVSGAPEPSPLASFGVGMAGIAGLLWAARRRAVRVK